MKKVITLFLLYLFTVQAFAQHIPSIDLENFYMPQLRDQEDCDKYIGQHICVFNYAMGNEKRTDAEQFNKYKTDITSYTIKKIKYGKQIVFTLQHGRDIKKVKVNNGRAPKPYELTSNNVFFLMDEFTAFINKIKGTKYKNTNGQEVATLENIEIIFRIGKDPHLVSTLKSMLNNERFYCYPENAQKVCNKIGTTVSHPLTKTTYKILSGTNPKLDIEESKGKSLYDIAGKLAYTFENCETGKTDKCDAEDIDTYPFEDDLAGHYISLLSGVEKPANPEARYGETTNVPTENGMSKFRYKDNIIDIFIFADLLDFQFVLKNISENTIKIIWDEAVFVDFDDNTEKVMHKGVNFAERNKRHPNTTIIKGAKWEDTVIPNNLTYYREAIQEEKEGGYTNTMKLAKLGKTPGQIKLMLPIQIKDIINEYIFTFDVKYIFKHPDRIR